VSREDDEEKTTITGETLLVRKKTTSENQGPRSMGPKGVSMQSELQRRKNSDELKNPTVGAIVTRLRRNCQKNKKIGTNRRTNFQDGKGVNDVQE